MSGLRTPPPAPPRLPKLFSVAEIAMALGVCEKTVRRWIDAKALPVHRIGRLVRIAESDLAEFVVRSREP